MAFLRVPGGLKAGRKPKRLIEEIVFRESPSSQTNAVIKAAATGMPAAAVFMRLSEVNPGAERETAAVFGRRDLIEVGRIDIDGRVAEDRMV